MSALLEMPIKRLSAHIYEIGANLALVFDTKSVKLEEPVRDRFTIPSKRKLKRVVDPLFSLFCRLFWSKLRWYFVDQFLQLKLPLPCGQCGSSLNVLLCIADKRRNWREKEESFCKSGQQSRVVASVTGAGAGGGALADPPSELSLSAALTCFFEVRCAS
jgi:hypothetical protein